MGKTKAPAKNETAKNIPVIRANREHINTLFGIFASLQEMEKAQEVMEKRIRSIPNGWRDFRLVCTVMNRLINDLCLTFPVEKLTSIQRMLPHMRYKVHCGVAASSLKDDENLIASDDLDTITRFSHEQCKLCVDQECSKCKLGRTYDRIFMYDRDGRSWANVDFERLKEEAE